MENEIGQVGPKRKFDVQEEKSLTYLGKVLNVERESMTVFLPYNLIHRLNRKHRACINYLKTNKGYNIQWEIA